jgi:DNA-binding transcriptional ArsR family regulator
MRELMAVLKALSDENRVRILVALEGRELCVCQIVELLGLATSTVSKHMSILRGARLVDGRKDGKWMYYRLADEQVPPAAAEATRLVLDGLARDAQIRDDRKRLQEILAMDAEDLCRRQSECKS